MVCGENSQTRIVHLHHGIKAHFQEELRCWQAHRPTQAKADAKWSEQSALRSEKNKITAQGNFMPIVFQGSAV
jgi:hypothetical protein